MSDNSKAGYRASQLVRLVICSSVLLLFIAVGTKAVISNGNQPVRTNLPQKSDGTIQPTNSPAFQRTKTNELAPIASSTQPLAPSTVPGQTQADANTIALYHFDVPNSLALDATGNYTGTLFGATMIAPTGLYSGVLSLDGNNSYVRLGNLGNPISGTVEAFVDFSAACPQTNSAFPIIAAGDEFGSNNVVLFLGQYTDSLVFGIYANGTFYWANSGINTCRYLTGAPGGGTGAWPYETWRFHHVAGTWGPRGIEIWVDGVLHGVGTSFAFTQIEPYPYMCNPQAQGKSNIYPLCQTPVMAPAMPAYPPGDYVGALPTYTTFLIGCHPGPAIDPKNPYWKNCFNGRIDEVRISNVQRTFQCLAPVGPYGPTQCVVPTITPTPTQTPVPITGEYTPDSQTVALYHLNYSVAGFPLRVMEEKYGLLHYIGGQSSIVNNGRFGAGLLSSGANSAIGTGNLGNIATGTLEAWVKFSDATIPQPLFSARQRDIGGSVLNFGGIANGKIRLSVSTGFVDSDLTVASLVGCWHHIAGTFGSRGMEIWIDGMLRGTNPSSMGGVSGIESNGGWQAGCSYEGSCMKSMLDEVRVSSVQRTFTVQSPSFRPMSRAPSALGFLTFLPFLRSSPSSGCAFGP